jgi:hypothetical protein
MPIYAQSSTLRNLTIPLVDIDHTTLEDFQVLQYNATTGKFENQAFSLVGADFVLDGLNLGGGEPIFVQENANNVLEFKTVIGGAGITLTSTGSELTINSSGAVVDGQNLGTGAEVFESKPDDATMNFRTLSEGVGNINLTITETANEIEFVNTAEINTASNIGTGEGVFAQKNVYDLEFKSLVAGDGIGITSDANEITLTTTGLGNTESYQFTVSFDASGNVTTVSDLPAGWASAINGNIVTITHTTGYMPTQITYWGFDATNGWQLRMPTAGYQVTIPVGSETTEFKLNVNSVVAGADVSTEAKVNVIF